MLESTSHPRNRIILTLGLLVISGLVAASLQQSGDVNRSEFPTTSPRSSSALVAPAEIASFDDSGPANDVAVFQRSGKTYALVAAAEAGLMVVNVTECNDPERIAHCWYDGANATAVASYGNYAFIADYALGLVVINTTDLTRPTVYGTFNDNDGGHAVDLVVQPNMVYLAEGSAGLEIIYLGGPSGSTFPDFSTAAEMANYTACSTVNKISYYPTRLYMACGSSGLVILDVNAPTPTLLGTYFDSGYAYSVFKSQDSSGRVYVGELSSFEVINATNPASPVELGNYSIGSYPVRDFVVFGSYAYLACDYSGIRSYDVTNPAAITQRDTIGTSKRCLAIVHDPGYPYVYVASSEEGLRLVNKTDPDDIFIMSTYADYGLARSIQVVPHEVAFLANGPGGLEIVNISDPTAPALLGKLDTAGEAVDVSVSGDIACIADYTNGIVFANVSDRAQPLLIRNYIIGGECYNVVLQGITGRTAYATASHGGLVILNCTDLSADPTIYSRIHDDPSNSTYGLAIAGNYAYITQLYRGLYIIDITNPSAPVTRGFYTRGTAPTYLDVTVVGSIAYVSNGAFGLDVVNVSDPTNPELIATYDPTPWINNAVVIGSAAFLSSVEGGMMSVDCSNLSAPAFAYAWNDDFGSGQGIEQCDAVLYMADFWLGLRILDSGYDGDEDGLSDWAEPNVYGTNMGDNDTDNDGLLDGNEITRGTNPLLNDTDGDGLLDGDEVSRGTNPLLNDTDGDGLLDGDEVARGTNPLTADTDGDGYSDKTEVDGGTDPLNPASNPGNTTEISTDWVIWVIVGAAGGVAAIVIVSMVMKKRKVSRD